MKKAQATRNQISFLIKACMVLLFSQIIGCKCGNSPVHEGEGSQPATVNGQSAKEDLEIKLTAPDGPELRGLFTGFKLKVKVVKGELDPNVYKLVAEHVESYRTDGYEVGNEVTIPANNAQITDKWGTVFTTKTLKDLTNNSAIVKKNDEINFVVEIKQKLSSTTYIPLAESGKFKFYIQDGAGNLVGSPIDMKWTQKTS